MVTTTDRYVLGHEGSLEYARLTFNHFGRCTQARIRIDGGASVAALGTTVDPDIDPEEFVRRWFDEMKAHADPMALPFGLSRVELDD